MHKYRDQTAKKPEKYGFSLGCHRRYIEICKVYINSLQQRYNTYNMNAYKEFAQFFFLLKVRKFGISLVSNIV